VKPCLDQPYASYITKATVALRVQKGSVGTFEWQRSIGFDPGRWGARLVAKSFVLEPVEEKGALGVIDDFILQRL